MSGETLRIRKKITHGNLLFGEYTLLHVLSQGRIGVICEAEHNSLKRPCALKLVHPTFAEREGYSLAVVDAFLREARIMAAIDHPSVVPVYHAGTVGQCPFIAMRLTRGGTLAGRLAASGAVTPDWALRLLRDCADALAAIHASGYRHADLQPENVLLDADGTPRVGGFDRAVPLDTADEESADQVSPYQPLEVSTGGVMDQRSDLWSLGATIAYAVSTVIVPADRPATAQQLAAWVVGATPAAGRSPLLTGLTTILARLLHSDLAARYDSADEVVEECRRLASGSAPIHVGRDHRHRKDHFAGWKAESGADELFPE